MNCPEERYTRRANDERINRIEQNVNSVKAKLENGISERTKNNAEKLEELRIKSEQLDHKLVEHIADSKAASDKSHDQLGYIKKAVHEVALSQKAWSRLLVRILLGALFVMLSLFAWTATHIDTISTIISNLINANNHDL